ncbi:MAG: hypothetical protein OEN23_12645 [Paracoccaceae bacterium]|nr:hypothetical protein [Paracoccaceae bacterium]
MFVLRNPVKPGVVGSEVSSGGSAGTGELIAMSAEMQSVARRLPAARPADDLEASDGPSTSAPPVPPRALSMLPIFAAAFPVRFGGPSAATECPRRIADTQRLIDNIGGKMKRHEAQMGRDAIELIHALLDDARMLLAAARDNHERPQSRYDHARAYAKADAAMGHAKAAEILHSRCSMR